jgi:hypothetical protein
MDEDSAMTPDSTEPPARRIGAAFIYLAFGIATFALVAAWDIVFLRLWGKN